MIEITDITIIIPSIAKNLTRKWVNKINYFSKKGIKIIISIPAYLDISKTYKIGFCRDISIVKSKSIGQVAQRQFGYKFCKTKFVLLMDDDIDITIKDIKSLLKIYAEMPENSCLSPYLAIYNHSNENNLLIKKLKYLFLYSDLNPNAGSIAKSSFPVPHNFRNNKNLPFLKEVDWLPGGIMLLKKNYLIKENYFNFKGKAYCEDLINSHLLKQNGIKLFITNKINFKTNVKSYRQMSLKEFLIYIYNDLKIRNHYRKIIKNKLSPFLIAYTYLVVVYLVSSFKKLGDFFAIFKITL